MLLPRPDRPRPEDPVYHEILLQQWNVVVVADGHVPTPRADPGDPVTLRVERRYPPVDPGPNLSSNASGLKPGTVTRSVEKVRHIE